MDGLDTLSHVALTDIQHLNLSFESYLKPRGLTAIVVKCSSPADDAISPVATQPIEDDPSVVAATAAAQAHHQPLHDDVLNTPVATTCSGLSTFFSEDQSDLPDPIPITGKSIKKQFITEKLTLLNMCWLATARAEADGRTGPAPGRTLLV